MQFNLADLFESIVDACPERTALVCEQRRLSYVELDERANRLANYWLSLGFGEGDHIGMQLRNGSEYIEGMLAAFKIRAVPININYSYVEAELAYIYDNADLVGLVCNRQFLPQVTAVAADMDKLSNILYIEDDSGVEVPGHCQHYEQVLANSSPDRGFDQRSEEDLYIIYTGGTTGMPKGVMWTHVDIFFSAMGGGDPDQSKGPIKAPEELVGRIPDMEMELPSGWQ